MIDTHLNVKTLPKNLSDEFFFFFSLFSYLLRQLSLCLDKGKDSIIVEIFNFRQGHICE